ncbi:MAG TPA: DUF72 domain-containing protein [Dehalococcoidia bacterium]|nr:hypothetical protein [Chloroflexota bacterium]MDP7160892.1 DUF72 domain-containing protein [Dehalococcoidia bacterium]MDP7515229.1 DUF72 domain-containing protein [Dehalococcoidia bacterium]HJM54248.1 DUF72 domain-containing protein [Dehalococcoidia bacterium]
MTAQQGNKRQGQDGGVALIGPQGWTGPDWRRLAYPKGFSTSGRLSWYARVFNAVEVNRTFYGIPSHSTVRTWRGSVPSGFIFAVKMPRQITHEPDLTSSAPELPSFLSAVSELGGSLGAVLIQIPPWFGPDRLPELSQWMSNLPVSETRFFLEACAPALHGPGYGSGLFESLERAGVGAVTTNLIARPGDISISPSLQAGYPRVGQAASPRRSAPSDDGAAVQGWLL